MNNLAFSFKSILFVILILPSCRSTAKVSEPVTVKPVLVTANTQNELAEIKKTYAEYSSFSAKFILKGKVENAEILYDGTIKAGKGVLTITLQDPVFRSPFFSLKVDKNMVFQTDHMRNKTDRVPLAQYRWVEVFGKVFPFRFFYPILKGFAPEEIYLATQGVSTESGEIRIRNETDEVEFASFSRNGKISRILFRSKIAPDTLLLNFSADSASKARHFPRTIMITRPGKEDFIRMTFSGVKFKLK